MVEKSKITHFAPDDVSPVDPLIGTTPDRSDLADLYPTAKTYEQKASDDEQLRESYRRRWPKRPYVNIALYGSAVTAVLVLFLQKVQAWIFASNQTTQAMTSVFFSFGIALAVLFLFVAWVMYVDRIFGFFGGRVKLFWAVYSFASLVLAVAWLSGVPWEYTHNAWMPVLMVSNLIVVFFAARHILEDRV